MKEKSGNGLRLMLAYRELVKYIDLYIPKMSKETMKDVIDRFLKKNKRNGFKARFNRLAYFFYVHQTIW